VKSFRKGSLKKRTHSEKTVHGRKGRSINRLRIAVSSEGEEIGLGEDPMGEKCSDWKVFIERPEPCVQKSSNADEKRSRSVKSG